MNSFVTCRGSLGISRIETKFFRGYINEPTSTHVCVFCVCTTQFQKGSQFFPRPKIANWGPAILFFELFCWHLEIERFYIKKQIVNVLLKKCRLTPLGLHCPVGIVVWSIVEAAPNKHGLSSSLLSPSFPGVMGPTDCLPYPLHMWPEEAFEFAVSDEESRALTRWPLSGWSRGWICAAAGRLQLLDFTLRNASKCRCGSHISCGASPKSTFCLLLPVPQLGVDPLGLVWSQGIWTFKKTTPLLPILRKMKLAHLIHPAFCWM